MMRNLLFILILLLSFDLPAQEDKWFFSLNMGGSFPLNTFAEESDDLRDGYAANGFSLSLEANYSISHSFALKGIALLNTNQIDRFSLWSRLFERMNQHFPIDIQDQQFLNLNVNPWVTNSILAGPAYIFKFENARWDFQALGGLNVSYLPMPTFTYENPANNWIYIHQGINTTHFSYGLLAGTSLSFPVSERFDFRLGLNYFYSRAIGKFEELRITKETSSISTEPLATGKSTIPVECMSATLGFIYYLR